MGFRKDFRELISFFSNRPKGYIPDQESVGGDRVKIGGISNRGSETIENSGVNISDSLHLLHKNVPAKPARFYGKRSKDLKVLLSIPAIFTI